MNDQQRPGNSFTVPKPKTSAEEAWERYYAQQEATLAVLTRIADALDLIATSLAKKAEYDAINCDLNTASATAKDVPVAVSYPPTDPPGRVEFPR